jgi:hypothetical protein
MEKEISVYFSEVENPRVEGRCMHLLSDILMISLLTYLTGGTDYRDMYLFTKERGREFNPHCIYPSINFSNSAVLFLRYGGFGTTDFFRIIFLGIQLL